MQRAAYTALINFVFRIVRATHQSCRAAEGYEMYDMANTMLVKLWLKPLVAVNFYNNFNVFLFPGYVNK